MPVTTQTHLFTGTFSPRGFGDVLDFSLDGSLLAVGAPRHAFPGAAGTDQGAVYLYDTSAPETPLAVLQPTTDPGDFFGNALGLSDDGRALWVGAPNIDNPPSASPDTGAVFVYGLGSGAPVLQTTLYAPDDGQGYDQFGWNLSLSGDGGRALVSASVQGAGATMLVYDIGASGPSHVCDLTPVTSTPASGFGLFSALSADGSLAAVSAHQQGSAGGTGAVYVFDLSGAAPVQMAQLTPLVSDPQIDFGASLALSADGSVLAVGADGVTATVTDAGSGGMVYVYDIADGDAVLRFAFEAEDTDIIDQFGAGLSMTADGATLLVGAPGWDGPGYDPNTGADANRGLLYAFDISGDRPVQLAAFAEDGGAGVPGFGFPAAISGDGSAVAGAENRPPLLGQQVALFSTAFLGWDRELGGTAADVLSGAAGSQALFGDAGGDSLSGRGGRDWLDGGAGKDRLHGGAGADMLIDGTGTDRLKGGAGADVFRFDADGQRDVVRDFTAGEDLLDLAAWDLDSLAELTQTVSGADLILAFGTETLVLRDVAALTDADVLF